MSRRELLIAAGLLIANLLFVEWVVYDLATGALGPTVDPATFNVARTVEAQPEQPQPGSPR